MRDVVGEVVVGSKDDGAVVVVALEQVIERVEFLFGCPGDPLGALLRDECPSSLRVIRGALEELRVALLLPRSNSWVST